MVEKSRYMRKFVILEKNEAEFPKEKIKNYKGYVKIEVRNGNGKVLFNVEGLDNVEGTDRVYKGYLLTKKRGKIVEVDTGTIMVNKKGKGNLEWKFNSESVGNSGLPITDFNVVLVKLAWVNGRNLDTVIPLYGYIDEKAEDINTLIKELKKELKTNKNNIIQKEDKIHSKDEKEVNAEKAPETHETEDSSDKDNSDNDNFKKDKVEKVQNLEKEGKGKEKEQKVEERKNEVDEEVESKGNEKEEESNKDDINTDIQKEYDFKKEDKKEHDSEDKDNYSKLKCDYNDNIGGYGHSVNKSFNYIQSIKDYSRQVAKWTLNTLKFFEEIQPFSNQLEGYQWWKIEYDSKGTQRGFLPYYSYVVNNYHPYPLFNKITTCQSLMRKYNHYIFGVVKQDEDIKYYVYGIPGKFKRSEQPFRGMTGFNTWIEKGGKNREKIGYWLIHIDAISGKIVNPLKPTTPGR